MADDKSQNESDCDVLTEEQIDEALAETFPASDPPPWTLGVENQCNDQNEQKAEPSKKKATNL